MTEEKEIKIERFAVDSSNVKSIGYDQENQILEIEFTNASIYRYFNVSEEIHRALIVAPSKGAFIAKHIKKVFECKTQVGSAGFFNNLKGNEP